MYFNYGQIPIVNKVLLGFIPAVAAIIVSTAWKMSLQTIKGWQEASIAFISAFLLIGIGGAYLTPLIIIISGLLGCLILNKPHISLAKSHPKILAIQHSIPFLNIDIFIIILLSLWALITKRNKPKIYLRKNHPKILTIQHSIPCLKLDTAIITLLSLWALMTKRNKPKIYLEKNHPKILGIQNNISFSKIDIVIIIGLFLCAFIVNTNLLLIPEKYTLLELFVTFAGMSVMLFGGAYVGIPLMEDIIVNQHQWLSQQEFTYALTAGQITPGPIVISAAFIGYKVASILGALVATIGIFLPPTLLMITSTKILENLKSSSQVQAAIYGMRPAVIGMIFAAAWAVGKTASPEGVSILIFIITLVALVYWRLNVVWIMPLAGLIGVFLDIS
jgi:putative chromate ion transporter